MLWPDARVIGIDLGELCDVVVCIPEGTCAEAGRVGACEGITTAGGGVTEVVLIVAGVRS